jgi:hypothetical protein
VTGRNSSEGLEGLAGDGERFYVEHLRAVLEPGHTGKFIAIEPRDGRYFMGVSGSEALISARSAMPENLFYLKRVGFDFTFKIGGRSLRRGRTEDA